MKPGCYGSILMFDAEDAICLECPFKISCGHESDESLNRLRKEMNLDEIVEKRYRQQVRENNVSIAPPENKTVNKRNTHSISEVGLEIINDESLPKKPREEVRRLLERGYDAKYIINACKQGVNPFNNNGSNVMRIACNCLIKGGFTRQDLLEAFTSGNESSMTEGTARSQVSIVCAAFKMMGVAVETDNKFKLRADYEGD